MTWTKTVITRKAHRCHGCARWYPKGSKLDVVTSVDGDGWGRAYWCDVCTKVITDSPYYEPDETFLFGAVRTNDQETWNAARLEVEGF